MRTVFFVCAVMAFFVADGLNNTWGWIDKDLTIVTVQGASHFVHQDATELVTATMRWWLLARQ